MDIEISIESLTNLLLKQLKYLFDLENKIEQEIVKKGILEALVRCEVCFENTKNKYYSKDGKSYFNPFHSGQYSIFLYFLANSIYKKFPKESIIADKIYYLNKALNGLDLFYEVEMPAIFMLDHPLGSVLGRAKYSNFFYFAQNCTVGNSKGIYPIIGENVKLLSGAKLLGNCKVGNNVILAANTYVIDTDIPDFSLVFGTSPNLTIKTKDMEYFKKTIAF